MTGSLELPRFVAAQESFAELVTRIGSDQWGAPTPCDAWDVRALVNHLVGEQRWATPMLQSKAVEEVGTALDGDLLGADPLAAWRSAAEESLAAFVAPGALDGTIKSSMGDEPARQYIAEMTSDLIVHRWDLGRAIGHESQFSDDELQQLDELTEHLAPMSEQLVSAGVFAEPKSVAADADAQTRVLAALGRDGS